MEAETYEILIAERDQRVRELQKFFLGRAGYTVEFADDGASALERARARQPAVIVTEILLPKTDGLSLCRRLQEDPDTRHIPVIVFSMLAAQARASEAGARAFIRKPLIESVFVDTVRDAIAASPRAQMEQS
jgi:CheY-like chemotaxis protein